MTATVIQFPWLGNRTTDGGKARIRKRRIAINLAEPIHDWRLDDTPIIDTRCDLSMGCADPEF